MDKLTIVELEGQFRFTTHCPKILNTVLGSNKAYCCGILVFPRGYTDYCHIFNFSFLTIY